MKRSLRRSKHGKKRGLAIFLIFALFFLIVSTVLFQLWAKKPLFISPIASDSQNVIKTLEKLLLDSDIEFSSVVFRSPSAYLIKLKEDGEAVLSLEKDIKKQITSLQAVLKQLTIEGKRAIRIDFRFDKPVITIQ